MVLGPLACDLIQVKERSDRRMRMKQSSCPWCAAGGSGRQGPAPRR